ncbi:tRNA processing endoribonuclease [Drepanopeziza brunnea f. sp. 'multigermtubi' MB_m1]|uniref:ribonuclease Z n=1 Tax=Marssonina brunnea f. sp. multigermtubi (strain MB_m1) TaxID=1072389 RepID=K1WRE7_MARBU|nr:tRNA processing endoribonuclease [Drepanopeziza brunnea f. sp. 'multigermtubi' MB_m1]EKD20210.1 tRNA processing endoribonuclease [Drepanopeziza brunnea f. sp. 'multigermtubi' MB_m1]
MIVRLPPDIRNCLVLQSRGLRTSATSPAPVIILPSLRIKRPWLRKPLFLHRVFPGPKLIKGTRIGAGYFLLFQENSIPSVENKPPSVQRNLARMKSKVTFLSTPTADTPGTTLLLHFDDKRYIIGDVAEGTQRTAIQRKLGLSKVTDIFLTGSVGWGNAGGILGTILTLADIATLQWEAKKQVAEKTKIKMGLDKAEHVEKQCLNIHGGQNLTHLLATARRFVFRKGMPLYTSEFRPKVDDPTTLFEPTWKDDHIKVWAMAIESEGAAPKRRKRSHEEFSNEGLTPSTSVDGTAETPAEMEERYDQMRKAVVSHMFQSEWRLDALVKTKLSKVQRPAAIFVRNQSGKIEKYHGPTVAESPSTPDIEVLVRNPWPGAMIESLPPTTPSKNSLCYIIKNHPQRGKFNPKVAKELGVIPGPAFKQLSDGIEVTTSAGNVVTPDMVLAKGSDGSGFGIMELPDSSYIAPLLARSEWSSSNVMPGIGAVIWILGPGVAEDPRLLKFMQEHPEMKHIVSSKECCSNYIALESPASAAVRLNRVDPERFPVPKFDNEPALVPAADTPYIQARVGQSLTLEPKVELQDKDIVPYLDMATVFQEEMPEVLELAKKAHEEISSLEFLAHLNETQQDIPCKDAEVITLGTGSALPSKYRNVSATLLRVPGYGSYLFDCGENTLGQIQRVFGDETPDVLRDLKVIWISHLHADHHLGTVTVAKEWARVTAANELTKDNTLIVASDDGMLKFLGEFAEVEDFGYDRVQPIAMARHNGYCHTFSTEDNSTSGLSSIEACAVEHCHGALAVVFNFPNGFKVAYSGDCRPSDKFVDIGRDATLLIHEATFDDILLNDAIAKKHSTTSEALDVGRKMNARRILLTHFSQRYQKIPVMDKEGKDQVAIVAFDYMRCKIEDFAKLDAFKDALIKLYEEKE